jgi:hypothetical protein
MSTFDFKITLDELDDDPILDTEEFSSAAEDETPAAATPSEPTVDVTMLQNTLNQATERNAQLEQALVEAEAARKKLEEEHQTTYKAQNETIVASIDNQIEQATEQVAKLNSEGNYTEAAKTNTELAKLITRRDRLVDEAPAKAEVTPADEPKPAEPKSQQQEVSPLANQWVADNPWFQTDRNMHHQARMIDHQLASEGTWDRNSPSYYNEINRRMKAMNPAAAAQLKNLNDPAKAEATPEPAAAEPQAKNPAPPAATTDDRMSGITKTTGGKFQVNLTKSERAACREMGISEEDYAKEKLAIATRNGDI